MNFKVVISDPKTRKAYQKEIEQKASGLLGKKIGEKISGTPLGLVGYELEITGGSDKDGFPMRRDVEGTARKRILVSSGPGFHPKKKGQRKRKSIRGNTISAFISQVNVKVTGYGQKSIESLLGIAKPEKEKPAEEKKEEVSETEEKGEEKEQKPEAEGKQEDKKEESSEGEAEKKEKPAEEEKKD